MTWTTLDEHSEAKAAPASPCPVTECPYCEEEKDYVYLTVGKPEKTARSSCVRIVMPDPPMVHKSKRAKK